MAKKKVARAAAKSTRKTAARKSAARKSNVEILIEKGALDPGAASRLDAAVVKKINKYNARDLNFLVKHQLEVCGIARPAPDGAFF